MENNGKENDLGSSATVSITMKRLVDFPEKKELSPLFSRMIRPLKEDTQNETERLIVCPFRGTKKTVPPFRGTKKTVPPFQSCHVDFAYTKAGRYVTIKYNGFVPQIHHLRFRKGA